MAINIKAASVGGMLASVSLTPAGLLSQSADLANVSHTASRTRLLPSCNSLFIGEANLLRKGKLQVGTFARKCQTLVMAAGATTTLVHSEWPLEEMPATSLRFENGPSVAPYVSMYDTTLRDGSQMVGISLSVSDKLKIAKLLTELGVEYIEGGWPGSNPKDAEFFQRWREVFAYAPAHAGQGGASRTKMAAFGSTRYKNTTCEQDGNVQALLASGAPVITLVAKAWDAQVERVLEATLSENLEMIRDTVSYFKVRGKEVMLDAEHFFDGFAANRQYAEQCVQTAAEAGADVIVLCDTNGGSMPWMIEEATRAAASVVEGMTGVRLGIHTHNDCELAVANSLAAVRGGASLVQGCINGYGERTGNANLVSVIGGLQAKMGHRCIPAEMLSRLSEISSTIAALAGQTLLASQPFVGSSAFAHKGGIHVAALRKMPESYNHMDPTLVGNSMRSVVSELSGRGNIFDKAEKAGLVLDREGAGSVLARIKQMESEGCAFEDASASVDMLIVRRGSEYLQPFRVMEFSVISSNRGDHLRAADVAPASPGAVLAGEVSNDRFLNSQAIVKLRIGNENQMSAAEGNGPVDALSHALRKALDQHFPQLAGVKLSDYRVRLVEPSEARRDSMSTTRVTIIFSDAAGNTWSTVGAHTSIVEASFQALVDGLEFGIANCSEAGCVVRE